MRHNLTQCAISHSSKDKKEHREDPIALSSETSLCRQHRTLKKPASLRRSFGAKRGWAVKRYRDFLSVTNSEDACEQVPEDGLRGLSVYQLRSSAKTSFQRNFWVETWNHQHDVSKCSRASREVEGPSPGVLPLERTWLATGFGSRSISILSNRLRPPQIECAQEIVSMTSIFQDRRWN